MDSFIVRVYRRGGKKSRRIVGVVESVFDNSKLAFENVDDLWDILKRDSLQSSKDGKLSLNRAKNALD